MVVAPYLDAVLLLLVTAAAINDLASRRIPNLLLLSGLVVALVLHAISPHPGPALLSCVAGMLTGLLIFLPFYLVRGMAAGDVKMLATIGAFTGAGDVFNIAILTWCAGGVMAIAVLVFRGWLRQALANVWGIFRPILLQLPATPATMRPSTGSIPYGVAIAAGTIYVLISRYA
jgi:prepilin peptidase CpaA